MLTFAQISFGSVEFGVITRLGLANGPEYLSSRHLQAHRLFLGLLFYLNVAAFWCICRLHRQLEFESDISRCGLSSRCARTLSSIEQGLLLLKLSRCLNCLHGDVLVLALFKAALHKVLPFVDVAVRVIALVEDMVPHLLTVATLMRVQHHLLLLGEPPGSVLVIWVLIYVGPGVVHGDGGRCDWGSRSAGRIIDLLDSEPNTRLLLINCSTP